MSGAISGGLVICGSKNIFTVELDSHASNGSSVKTECRIKGKVLKSDGNFYNPIAPGDRVTVDTENCLILGLEERRNAFSRFNKNGSQLLAANIDLALCMTTPSSPPFRPRFLDRILAQADASGVEAVILCNKSDLYEDANDADGEVIYTDPDVEERLEDYRRIGYKVLMISAKTGKGLDELKALIAGKLSVIAGQSGVGKSSLLNALAPEYNLKIGSLVEKYDRGSHTTTMSFMITVMCNDGKPARIIDTPGVRLFTNDGIAPGELILHFREFAPLAGKCSYGLSCTHRTEPGCKIMEAVNAGIIHEDRYESFLRVYDELENKNG